LIPKELGLFCKRRIFPGTLIAEYRGVQKKHDQQHHYPYGVALGTFLKNCFINTNLF
jgi:hypothetical protein